MHGLRQVEGRDDEEGGDQGQDEAQRPDADREEDEIPPAGGPGRPGLQLLLEDADQAEEEPEEVEHPGRGLHPAEDGEDRVAEGLDPEDEDREGAVDAPDGQEDEEGGPGLLQGQAQEGGGRSGLRAGHRGPGRGLDRPAGAKVRDDEDRRGEDDDDSGQEQLEAAHAGQEVVLGPAAGQGRDPGR